MSAAAILADPAASDWLKSAIRASRNRDLCDMLNDVDALREVLRAEFRRAESCRAWAPTATSATETPGDGGDI